MGADRWAFLDLEGARVVRQAAVEAPYLTRGEKVRTLFQGVEAEPEREQKGVVELHSQPMAATEEVILMVKLLAERGAHRRAVRWMASEERAAAALLGTEPTRQILARMEELAAGVAEVELFPPDLELGSGPMAGWL